MFQYIEQDSFIHSLNPMMKLLGIFLAVLLLVFLFDPIPVLFVLALALVLLNGLARIPLKSAVRGILPFVGIGFGLAWVNIVFSQVGGEVIWQWGFIDITTGSLRVGLSLGLRVVAIVGFGFLFAATTNPREIVVSMVQQAHLPYKMAFGVYIGLRFLPLLSTELDNIRAAHRIRGGIDEESWWGRYRAFTKLIVPLFTAVIRKSILLGLAMESKAFGAYPDRTYLFETRVTWRDWLFVLGILLVLVLAIVIFSQMGFITRFGLWQVR